MVKKIIINFPSNIGDTFLALPTLDKLKSNYPNSKVSAISSPKTDSFLIRHTFIDEVILFDKSWPLNQKRKFAFSLRGKFEMIIDFKNSFLPVILGTKIRTPFLRKPLKELHQKDRYLWLISKITKDVKVTQGNFELSSNEKSKWDNLNLKSPIFIAGSSRSKVKMYDREYLKTVLKVLSEKNRLVVLGQRQDRDFYGDILALENVVDLVGKTQISDVFYLLKKYAEALLVVDSGILHLASYINTPMVALIGSTTARGFEPYSEKNIVLEDINTDPERRSIKIDPMKVIEAVRQLC